MERKKAYNLNEVYFYIAFSFFKTKDYQRANEVFDHYSFASSTFNLIALYKLLIRKILLLQPQSTEQQQQQQGRGLCQERMLEEILGELIHFHDQYEYMFKNISFFYYKNNSMVTLDELKFHIGELLFELGRFEQAYGYLRHYAAIAGLANKIAFEPGQYLRCFYRTLHKTTRYDDLFAIVAGVPNETDEERYFKGASYFYKPLLNGNDNKQAEFFANKNKCFECLYTLRNKEYVYYKEAQYLKLKCLFFRIMQKYKESNSHEMNVAAKQFFSLDSEFSTVNDAHIYIF